MRILLVISTLFFLSVIWRPSYGSQLLGALKPPRKLEFHIFYPLVFKEDSGVRIRQDHYAGVDMQYQFYFNSYFGWTFMPLAYFVPLRQGGQNGMYALVALLAGLSARALPDSYFDPTFSVQSGVGATDAGSLTPGRIGVPVIGRSSFSVYRSQQRFQDTALALNIVGNVGYQWKQIEMMKPYWASIGLAFSGSF
jgi:hypothetical protein